MEEEKRGGAEIVVVVVPCTSEESVAYGNHQTWLGCRAVDDINLMQVHGVHHLSTLRSQKADFGSTGLTGPKSSSLQ